MGIRKMIPFNKEDYKYKINGKDMPQTQKLLKYVREQGAVNFIDAFDLMSIKYLSAIVREVNSLKELIGERESIIKTTFSSKQKITEYYLL